MAALTLMAFSNAARVMIVEGRTFSPTMSTMRRPARWAITKRLASTAGIAAEPGNCIPSASAMQAIVDAVPIVMQWPLLRFMQPSASEKSASDIRPAIRSCSKRHTSVPEPMSRPWNFPLSIGPPVTMIAGMSTLAAAMS